jgi:hypothetical protein
LEYASFQWIGYSLQEIKKIAWLDAYNF